MNMVDIQVLDEKKQETGMYGTRFLKTCRANLEARTLEIYRSGGANFSDFIMVLVDILTQG